MKLTIAIALFLIAIASVVLYNPTGALNVLSVDTNSCEAKNQLFDPKNQLTADIYYAQCTQNISYASRPTMVFVYGGGWKSGNSHSYEFVAHFFTKRGFNVVLPNYRLHPKAAYPDFINDLDTFFIWLEQNAEPLQLNTETIFLAGHSAGAFNSAVYLFDTQYKKPFTFRGFIGFAGPYDFFLPTSDKQYQDVFEDNAQHFNTKAYLPIEHVKSNSQITSVESALILHGTNDTIVTPKNAKKMRDALNEQGVTTHHILYEGVNHTRLIGGLSSIPFIAKGVAEDVEIYLKNLE